MMKANYQKKIIIKYTGLLEVSIYNIINAVEITETTESNID